MSSQPRRNDGQHDHIEMFGSKPSIPSGKALYRPVSGTNDVHALLTDEYIEIANRGRSFTHEGLRAVCQAHISPKSDIRITPITDEAGALELLEKIRTERLNAYKSCLGDLAEHANAESVLRREYAGRILTELLQNAHDAAAADPIGSKGVGFKAVLNMRWAENPLGLPALRLRPPALPEAPVGRRSRRPRRQSAVIALPFNVLTAEE